ncbi:hypothetical protein [Campylobacter sp. RM16187]|uniref:hypothetical protein n=1 Tax=Campylobacter sp. RM16187 TaxID=1660063 RepID=UPI0021B67CEE|nr:hypothetical protein [Campylobacter sp. RM16187]QKG28593.1 hypothetical protein CDOMF_0304 [Campylobacter sp. RM16187]
MSSSGFVKEVIGRAIVVDMRSQERELNKGDVLNIGDTVFTSSENDSIVLSFGSEDIALVGIDSLKIDQSIVSAESFGDESNLQESSLEKAILEIQSFEAIEEVTTESFFIESNDGFDSKAIYNANNAEHASISSDSTLDLSKVSDMKHEEQTKLMKDAIIEKVSAQDMLDVGDKKDGLENSLNVENNKDVSISYSNEYKNSDTSSETTNATISIKIESEIQVDI